MICDGDHGMSHYQTKQNLRGHIQKELELINNLDHDQIINQIDGLDQFVRVTNLKTANCQHKGLDCKCCNFIESD